MKFTMKTISFALGSCVTLKLNNIHNEGCREPILRIVSGMIWAYFNGSVWAEINRSFLDWTLHCFVHISQKKVFILAWMWRPKNNNNNPCIQTGVTDFERCGWLPGRQGLTKALWGCIMGIAKSSVSGVRPTLGTKHYDISASALASPPAL